MEPIIIRENTCQINNEKPTHHSLLPLYDCSERAGQHVMVMMLFLPCYVYPLHALKTFN